MSSAIAGTLQAAHSPFSVLLTTSLVSSLIMLDSNIVAITLPTIGRSLSASFTDIRPRPNILPRRRPRVGRRPRQRIAKPAAAFPTRSNGSAGGSGSVWLPSCRVGSGPEHRE
jgi:hypothetical protein